MEPLLNGFGGIYRRIRRYKERPFNPYLLLLLLLLNHYPILNVPSVVFAADGL